MPDASKTHTLRPSPGMSIRMLADYMSASEQAKRSLLVRSKFMPIAPTIQHDAARESIGQYVSSGGGATDAIAARIATLKNGLQGSPFEIEKAENNADYLERFLETMPGLPARVQEASIGGKMQALDIEGFSLRCTPDFVFHRVTRTNIPKIGLGFLRYAKGKALNQEVACWQGAIAVGYLTAKVSQGLGDVEADREITAVIDVWTGQTYIAPTNSVYRFNEVKAACVGIAQRWDQIPPPTNAVF